MDLTDGPLPVVSSRIVIVEEKLYRLPERNEKLTSNFILGRVVPFTKHEWKRACCPACERISRSIYSIRRDRKLRKARRGGSQRFIDKHKAWQPWTTADVYKFNRIDSESCRFLERKETSWVFHAWPRALSLRARRSITGAERRAILNIQFCDKFFSKARRDNIRGKICQLYNPNSFFENREEGLIICNRIPRDRSSTDLCFLPFTLRKIIY